MKFSEKKYNTLVKELGKLYSEFIEINKSDFGPVSPNDHIVGAIGEWRAIQIIKKTMSLEAKRASTNSKSSNDLVVKYKNKDRYISVKSTTEHSKTGLSGIFHTGQGEWDHCLCIRLEKDLTYKDHFWISKKEVNLLFTHSDGRAKQFKWAKAESCAKKGEYPSWFKLD
ncbi:MAG: hypothetical protein H7281_15265 [Bacteriovorax sp.]|nr:hypothetical protein [Bacteriovorax sp.]